MKGEHENRESGECQVPVGECPLHSAAVRELQENSRLVKLAVCGDETLGVDGLVKDVKELKSWRRQMDLRTAGIAGGVSAVAWLVKTWLGK